MVNTIERQTDGYCVEEVIDVIKRLSYSQGFYDRLLKQILYFKEYEPDIFDEFKRNVEAQRFMDPTDVALFFEC